MIKTFTQTDLIRYIYHETTEQEEQEIAKALHADTELRAQNTNMMALKTQMDQAELQPSSSTILNILSYSKSTNPHNMKKGA